MLPGLKYSLFSTSLAYPQPPKPYIGEPVEQVVATATDAHRVWERGYLIPVLAET